MVKKAFREVSGEEVIGTLRYAINWCPGGSQWREQSKEGVKVLRVLDCPDCSWRVDLGECPLNGRQLRIMTGVVQDLDRPIFTLGEPPLNKEQLATVVQTFEPTSTLR